MTRIEPTFNYLALHVLLLLLLVTGPTEAQITAPTTSPTVAPTAPASIDPCSEDPYASECMGYDGDPSDSYGGDPSVAPTGALTASPTRVPVSCLEGEYLNEVTVN